MSKITLGIDISQCTFDAALLFENNKVKHKKFTNHHSGFQELIEWLKKHEAFEAHVCLEATGTYGEVLATYLFEIGLPVSVVNPARIKGFARSELSRTKTDKSDSTLIARFCRAMHPELWQPKPLYIQELRLWVRRLEELQGLYQQEANRLQVMPSSVRVSIKTVCNTLEKEMERVKKAIKEQIEQHPQLREKKQLLETIPGIGDATIAYILAFIGNIEDFKHAKQLVAFVGLNPSQKQSGTSVQGRARLSKIGHSNLRKAFYMPAIVAKRHNPIIRAFREGR